MVKHKQAQETKSKVKLYKTKRGWFSALTRFFGLLSFMSKKEVQPIDLNDLDALKDADTSDNYKKGIATVATLFGMGAIGAVSPTEVHAATTTVDYSSQVIGSGSTSVSTSTSQSMTSTSGSTASQSTSTSTVSQSMQSNSLSVNSVSGSTTSTTIFEGTTTSSMVSENSSNSISGSQAIENSDAASIDQSGSHSNSTTADSITGSTSLDNEKTSIEESASTSYLEENGMATILPATGNNDGETSVANRTVTEGNIVQLAENIKEVSNEEELKAALQDASITTIKLKNNITLNNAITINNGNRNITIIGDGHYINALNSDGGIILNNSSGSAKIDLTIENATLYNTSKYGFVNMSSNGADTVTYKDVTAYGGTLVWSKTDAGVKTLNLVGNTTLNSVKSYEVDGQLHNTEMFSQITPVGDKTTALYVSNAINVADNANVVLNNSATDIDMWLLTAVSSSKSSTVTVGNNASLTMENIGNTEYNIKLDGALYNNFIVNENAAVKMSAKVDNVRIIPQLENAFARGNIDLAKGSNVHLEVITGSNFRMAGIFANKINFNGTATLIKQTGNDTQANIVFNWFGLGGNTVNFNPGADVALIAGKGASNIGASSYGNVTVNINDPLRVAFNTDKLGTDQNGVTYLGNPNITVNVENATIKVDDNDFSELISSNKTNVTGSSVDVGSVSLNSNSTSYANVSESLSASLSFSIATSMATSQLAAVNNGSQVIYGGSTSIYNSQSMSASLSLSTSASLSESLSTSLSESLSTSVSFSESISTSISLSESLSTSLSESLSTSVSLSESISTSISLSESLSTSLSESLSTSVSLSESISTSISLSESLSTSLSESLSNSVSVSESMSNSVSMSESLSNSVSMSESLSNSVSMSESMSNSVSMSESLSNSVSMSESLSNSVSMSESLSNSVSMSESMSNSVSMSESLSNSVSMSESLSNSVSMSESLSNSVSMSESLSNSVSMSESLSNSVSMSESLSNSVSMSESLSNSVSMSESLSNSVSMSESLSNSVSMSESLSNSVSMSES
ncbi:serine-rich glycoprotein adhesin, partial [Limosilactobacillus reuteri]